MSQFDRLNKKERLPTTALDRSGFALISSSEIPGVQVLQLSAQRDGAIQPIGSAVMIGPYLAVTASHVIKQFYERLQPGEISFEDDYVSSRKRILYEYPKFVMFATLFDGEGKSQARFFVELGNLSTLTDIAVLKLLHNPDEPNFRFETRPITLLPPPVGSLIDAFGYVADFDEENENDHSEGRVVECGLYASRGEVSQYLLEGRGKHLAFPMFETNAHFAGGMSGGPVFNQRGQLCGLVCYDMGDHLDDPTAPPVSYATMLFPILGCQLEYDLPGEPLAKRFTIKELCARGILSIPGSEQFVVEANDDGWTIGVVQVGSGLVQPAFI